MTKDIAVLTLRGLMVRPAHWLSTDAKTLYIDGVVKGLFCMALRSTKLFIEARICWVWFTWKPRQSLYICKGAGAGRRLGPELDTQAFPAASAPPACPAPAAVTADGTTHCLDVRVGLKGLDSPYGHRFCPALRRA